MFTLNGRLSSNRAWKYDDEADVILLHGENESRMGWLEPSSLDLTEAEQSEIQTIRGNINDNENIARLYKVINALSPKDMLVADLVDTSRCRVERIIRRYEDGHIRVYDFIYTNGNKVSSDLRDYGTHVGEEQDDELPQIADEVKGFETRFLISAKVR